MNKLGRFAAVLSAGLLGSVAYAQCGAYGAATDCTTLITVNSSGTLSVVGGPGGTTYDGADDQLVGFTNNWTKPISSITLDGGSGNAIFGFESDGIDTYGAPGNTTDTTGYGGPDAYFSNISTDGTMGVVNFVNAIDPGGFTYFSLEQAFSASNPITGNPGGGSGVTPEPSTFLLLGTGAAGLIGTLRRRVKG